MEYSEMNNKIAFEEHMAIPETIAETKDFAGESGRFDDFVTEILDLDDQRLGMMDSAGIELAILSLNAPAIQSIRDTQQAIDTARKANDVLAAAVARHPGRYLAMAALPMQDPVAAADELQRCVSELGFVGALVNGFTQVAHHDEAVYYDIPAYRPFWETVQSLDVPFYLHPRMSLQSQSQSLDGHPWLRSSPWGFSVETSIHALRLCGSGLFEDFPSLQIVVGHLGELIPFNLWRIDARMAFSPRGYRGKRPLGDYYRENFWITTSGNFCDATLRCVIEMLGTEKLCFSSDFPFERMQDAANWFDSTPVLDERQRKALGRTNACRLFKLA
jgi:2,3-dihydroxybenzoate decarboxylase